MEDDINKKNRNEISRHGLTVLKPHHSLIRHLKRLHEPSTYGNRVWETSWMLIDYIKQAGLPNDLNVLEIGCGWGLPGIYCAKSHKAMVTCLDKDSAVFPFLELHAEVNHVNITTLNEGFEWLTVDNLSGFDVLFGAEICFWDEMAPQLKILIQTARLAGVRLILIADPGRPPFKVLEKHCLEHYNQGAIHWRIRRPYEFAGRILRIDALKLPAASAKG
jgi:predicted nicotinamide N-methyase